MSEEQVPYMGIQNTPSRIRWIATPGRLVAVSSIVAITRKGWCG